MKPPTAEQVADAVLAAVHAQDAGALHALASKDDPDPWQVADELIARGEPDAAEAFAKEVPRVDVEHLPAYVASRRGKPDDAVRRGRVVATNAALAAKKPREALETIGVLEPSPPEDVVGIRLLFGSGMALRALNRLEESAKAFVGSADAAERIGWLARAAWALHEAGVTAYRRADYRGALPTFERLRALSVARGDHVRMATVLVNLGSVQLALGNHVKALEAQQESLRLSESLGDRAGMARALGNVGSIHLTRAEYAKALEYLERSLVLADEVGDRATSGNAVSNLGVVQMSLGNHDEALALFERSLATAKASRNRTGETGALANIGAIHSLRSDYPKALECYERVLQLEEEHGDRARVATVLNNIGTVHQVSGSHAKALTHFERSLKLAEEAGDLALVAGALANLSTAQLLLGSYLKALAAAERARDLLVALGRRADVAKVVGNIGIIYRALSDYPKALEYHEQAIRMRRELGDRSGMVAALVNVANVQYDLEDYAKALASYEAGIQAAKDAGARRWEARALLGLGGVHHALGSHAQALEHQERALRMAKDLGDADTAVTALGNLGLVCLSLRDYPRALAYEREAVKALNALVRGLGAEEGAGAREPRSEIYVRGARAAVAAADPSELAFFLESGRAGALIEGLRARETLWAVAVPAELRAEEASARAAEGAATKALDRALDGDDLDAARARRSELAVAQERVSAVIARIQREAKAGASLVYPEVATLDEIRATLEGGDALVLYGSLGNEVCALAVTKDVGRIVKLGASARIRDAVEALRLGEKDGDPSAAFAALAKLVVEPLGLPASTKRLLLSPSGVLGGVPFAVLVEGPTVSYLPSGSTLRLLRGETTPRGEGVLALGDPDYEAQVDEQALAVLHRDSHLARLPSTAGEAQALGTHVLLRADASEAGLASALRKQLRWRAVHFACHGHVDDERPGLSWLALTPSGDDDGFLTALEIYRSKILADLVVLSACETGKGQVVRTEGVVGLSRAFMFAGSPRVICSLWKVNDAATAALMTKFHELWSPKSGQPGLPTAEALRKAQEFVRDDSSHPRWKHPYYWAAWVLWGLPE